MNIAKTLKSFFPAFKGVRVAIATENNLQVHLLASIVAIATGFILKIDRYDWLMVVIAIAMVFITEFMNTALEHLVDLVSPGFNEVAGRVKDIAAGASLIAAIASIVMGLIVFLPYLIK